MITSSIEHPGIINFLLHLQAERRIDLCVLPVDEQGFISIPQLEQALTPATALVTVMHSNNEVGVIQPMRQISRAVRAFNASSGADVLLHSDVAQSLGALQCSAVQCSAVQCSAPTVLCYL